MPAEASAYDVIFDLEGAIEPAARDVLKEFGVEAFTQQEVEDLPATRVDIELIIGGVTGHRGKVSESQWSVDAWNGDLRFYVVTPRRRKEHRLYNPTEHGRMRARVRYAAQYFADRFGAERLPYHVLTSIQEAGTDPAVAFDDDTDVSTVTFRVVISVRKGAWHVS